MRLPLHLLMPDLSGIPVLMYHKVSAGGFDRLTIDPDLLQDHFSYLHDHGFRALSLQEFLDITSGKAPASERSFLLTFDDGYSSHYTLAYPLIRRFGFKATFFVIGNNLKASSSDATEAESKMTVAEMKLLDPGIVQLALHSYAHPDFGVLSLSEIQSDLEKNIAAMDETGLVYHKVLAYPYGARPAAQIFNACKEWMRQIHLNAAFRIGNKPQRLPVADRFNIRRIDIRGTDTVRDLSVKLRKGKLKPF